MIGKSDDPTVLHVGNTVMFHHPHRDNKTITYFSDIDKPNTVPGNFFENTLFVIRDIIIKPSEYNSLMIELEITHTDLTWGTNIVIWVPSESAKYIYQYPMIKDVLNAADELLEILEWGHSYSDTDCGYCPICRQRKSEGHVATCKVKKYKELRTIFGG